MVLPILLLLLALVSLAFVAALVRGVGKGQGQGQGVSPSIEGVALGAVTNFFDTLGIGSFAPTTAWLRFRRLVPDVLIPGTLNVGHALPTAAQSAVFLVLLGVHVDPLLLVTCVIAAVAGALLGAPLVVRAPVRLVQASVGVALILASALYAMSNLSLMPIGGDAAGLAPPMLWVAIGAHFVMGVLMTFGVGLYAPSLILLSLLGLDPRLAFPIMASACAFLMPVAGFRFVAARSIDLGVVIGMAIGGIPAVLAAAFIVKSLPIEPLRWGVVVVALCAAGVLLRAAAASKQPGAEIKVVSGGE